MWALVRLLLCACFLLTVLAVGLFLWADLRLPSREQIIAMMTHAQIEVDVSEDRRLRNPVCRNCGIYLNPGEIPDHMKDAVIAIEDRRFHWHLGLDPIALVRAVLANFRAKAVSQGGSTITQQLAKFLMLSSDRNLARKLREAVLAVKLELFFTKQEILTAYLNHAYFGSAGRLQVHGVEQAARAYFQKRARQLNLYEAALLAGALKAPNRYNLLGNRPAAHERTRVVLAAMVRSGVISEDQARDAQDGGIRPGNKPVQPIRALYFTQWIMTELATLLPQGMAGQKLTVITTLDPTLQLYADLAGSRLLENGARWNASQFSLVAMDPDGAVRAMVGGGDFAQTQFNRATQAFRQPASAFKPVVYLAALEQGYEPSSLVPDRPIAIDGWRPRNFDGRYHGEVYLMDALAQSYNVATVRLALEIGCTPIAETAARLGLRGISRCDPSSALGTEEVRLIDLTAAYAVFANGGRRVKPHGILGIRDHRGAVLYWRAPPPAEQVVAAYAARAVNAMLRRVVTVGTGREAAFGHPAAGKTGTSQNHRDAWFVGYTAHLVTGIWLGNDDGAPMHKVTGGLSVAPTWRNFMANAHIGRPVREIARRPEIKQQLAGG